MDIALSAFIAVLLTEMGGKVQAQARRLSTRFPGAGAKLLLLVFCTSLGSLAVGAAGGAVVAEMIEERARLLLVAIALVFAGTAMIIPFRVAPLPAASGLIATGLPRLLIAQLGDASQFLIFALSAWSDAPVVAALAGTIAVAGAAAVPLAIADQRADGGAMILWRRVAAGGLILAGLGLALTALRLI